MERLDKALADIHWCNQFPATKVSHLASSYSDPVTLKISIQKEAISEIKRKTFNRFFRFEERWLGDVECENVIRTFWKRGQGNPVSSLCHNGQTVFQELSNLSKKKFGNLKTRITGLQEKFSTLQCNPSVPWRLRQKLKLSLMPC